MWTKLLHTVEHHLHWLPYVTVLLVICSEVQVSGVLSEKGAQGLLLARYGMLVAVTLLLLIPQLALCLQTKSRVKATLAMVSAVVVVMLVLSIVERVAPPIHQYEDFQLGLQGQLARRSATKQIECQGVQINQVANDLGFIDRNRLDTSDRRRVVFIGDSFLESVSNRPLALRVEDRLNQAGHAIDVVNLSKDDTQPDPDYRHKLHELAFDYHPDHVFVFIYAGNDLHRRYRYTPYRHQPYRISDQAIAFLRRAAIDDQALATLADLNSDQVVLSSKADLLEHFGSLRLALDQSHLIYLACLAYTDSTDSSFFRQIWPQAIERLGVTGAAISRSWEKMRKSIFSNKHRAPAVSWADLRDRYEAIARLSKDQQLEALARFLAHDYYRVKDEKPYLDVLKTLDPALIDAVIHEPAPPGLLLKGLSATVGKKGVNRSVNQSRLNRSADEFVWLAKEFHAVAASHGAGLTVVLIPVAGHGDGTFYRYWKPLFDVRQYFQRRKVSQEAVHKRLSGVIPMIDFMDFPGRFDGGYWKFDGHWNEKGNRVAAQILSDYIMTVLDDS